MNEYQRIMTGLAIAHEHETKEENRIEYYQTRAENVGAISYGNDASRGTPAGDRLETDAIKLAAYKKKIAPERRERFKLRAEAALEFVGYLETDQAELVRMRHIDQLTIRQIADRTGMSVGWISEKIKAAEEKLKKVL